MHRFLGNRDKIGIKMYPLAIFTPHIGALSESFVKRHIEDILPGRAVVVTETIDGGYLGHWSVKNPQLIIDHIPARATPNGLRQHVAWAIGRRLGRRTPDSVPDALSVVKQFLRNHGVRAIMGEYMDYSLKWISIAKELSIPFFVHAHGYDVSLRLREDRWRSEYMRYNDADGIITVSEASRSRLVELGLRKEKVHAVACGVDVPDRFEQKREKPIVRCFAAGRMVTKKAPILLLDAFRRAAAARRDIRLDYIGTGEQFAAARHFVDAMDLCDRVTLHGGQQHERVLEFMREADIFLQHSITDPLTGDEEGLPVSVLEAMAQGTPVVSTKHAGIPEAVIDGETGYLVDEGDSITMAARIVALAGDASLRRQMGTAAWQRAQKCFSWDRERTELLRILKLDGCLTESL